MRKMYHDAELQQASCIQNMDWQRSAAAIPQCGPGPLRRAPRAPAKAGWNCPARPVVASARQPRLPPALLRHCVSCNSQHGVGVVTGAATWQVASASMAAGVASTLRSNVCMTPLHNHRNKAVSRVPCLVVARTHRTLTLTQRPPPWRRRQPRQVAARVTLQQTFGSPELNDIREGSLPGAALPSEAMPAA